MVAIIIYYQRLAGVCRTPGSHKTSLLSTSSQRGGGFEDRCCSSLLSHTGFLCRKYSQVDAAIEQEDAVEGSWHRVYKGLTASAKVGPLSGDSKTAQWVLSFLICLQDQKDEDPAAAKRLKQLIMEGKDAVAVGMLPGQLGSRLMAAFAEPDEEEVADDTVELDELDQALESIAREAWTSRSIEAESPFLDLGIEAETADRGAPGGCATGGCGSDDVGTDGGGGQMNISNSNINNTVQPQPQQHMVDAVGNHAVFQQQSHMVGNSTMEHQQHHPRGYHEDHPGSVEMLWEHQGGSPSSNYSSSDQPQQQHNMNWGGNNSNNPGAMNNIGGQQHVEHAPNNQNWGGHHQHAQNSGAHHPQMNQLPDGYGDNHSGGHGSNNFGVSTMSNNHQLRGHPVSSTGGTAQQQGNSISTAAMNISGGYNLVNNTGGVHTNNSTNQWESHQQPRTSSHQQGASGVNTDVPLSDYFGSSASVSATRTASTSTKQQPQLVGTFTAGGDGVIGMGCGVGSSNNIAQNIIQRSASSNNSTTDHQASSSSSIAAAYREMAAAPLGSLAPSRAQHTRPRRALPGLPGQIAFYSPAIPNSRVRAAWERATCTKPHYNVGSSVLVTGMQTAGEAEAYGNFLDKVAETAALPRKLKPYQSAEERALLTKSLFLAAGPVVCRGPAPNLEALPLAEVLKRYGPKKPTAGTKELRNLRICRALATHAQPVRVGLAARNGPSSRCSSSGSASSNSSGASAVDDGMEDGEEETGSPLAKRKRGPDGRAFGVAEDGGKGASSPKKTGTSSPKKTGTRPKPGRDREREEDKRGEAFQRLLDVGEFTKKKLEERGELGEDDHGAILARLREKGISDKDLEVVRRALLREKDSRVARRFPGFSALRLLQRNHCKEKHGRGPVKKALVALLVHDLLRVLAEPGFAVTTMKVRELIGGRKKTGLTPADLALQLRNSVRREHELWIGKGKIAVSPEKKGAPQSPEEMGESADIETPRCNKRSNREVLDEELLAQHDMNPWFATKEHAALHIGGVDEEGAILQ